MSKSTCLSYDDELAQIVFALKGQMAFKRVGKEYLVYCFMCNRYEKVSKEKWQQIRAAKVCSNCGRQVNVTNLKSMEKHDWIRDGNYGYWVQGSWKFGKHPKAKEVRFVADWSGKQLEVLGIVKTFGCSLSFNDNPNWRKVRKGNTYHYCFWERGEVEKRTLKDYYLEIKLPFKSNQVTLIKNGIYSHNQMRYIYWFDLKTDEEVQKYSSYMNQNPIQDFVLDPILNVYYLDYLAKNKINISDFKDYIRDCEKLKLKIQKPKNFQEEHMRVNALIDLKENEVYAEQVIERQKELLENEAKIDNAEFRTFSSVADIVFVGKVLHNCIARTYTHIYAEGKCDLYYVKMDGKITIAIEVKNKKIIQARENHNKKVENEKARLVKKWAKLKGFAYG